MSIDPPPVAFTERDKVELEHGLTAQENVRAFDRDLRKVAQEHEDSLDSAEKTAASELQKAQWDAEFGLAKLFHEKISELAGGSIERSRDSAKYVQTAAAWIATLYTGLLALVFSVTEYPLPLRGLYAAVFLGLSVALAAVYLAFVSNPGKLAIYKGGASLTEQQMNRTGFLIKWVNVGIRDRRWAIRVSVICLALGVAFIPVAFIANSRPASIPDAPVAPVIPGAVSPDVSSAAVKLFEQQISGYEAAVDARNKAIEEAPMQAASVAKDEQITNKIALYVFIFALLAALFAPLIYGHFADKDET